MVKNKNRKKSFAAPSESDQTTTKPNNRSRQLVSAGDSLLPLPFPSHLKCPSGDFLRDQPPHNESFKVALNTAYEGFVVDESVADEHVIQNALDDMLQQSFFRKDVTQPFGLGTKCAKTFVTRCVVGDEGTTYKYLGLRMFSHPWDNLELKRLGLKLAGRAQHHLNELDETRRRRGAPPTRGRALFDICLVNRMEASADLKVEPSMGKLRTSVSWHADSSLEHFSTIAVYQTLPQAKDPEPEIQEIKWSVALRVAHNSEGPLSSRRGTDIESSIVTDTPPIAVSLPSGSAYYLLDDFNHHHQHTVLTSGDVNSAGVRYSCTYRLLRESHNVKYVIDRCRAVCSNFHKKGSKLWRSEQLLLTELESEWLRQFYIQGEQHHDLLWPVSLNYGWCVQ
jgi:alpha-ketoglutarate-dependent dioxygenase FTO